MNHGARMVMTVRWSLLVTVWLLHAASSHAADPLAGFGVIVPEKTATAPAFTLTTLEGGKVSLADYRGKVVFINFWATWCAPCREEMPSMQMLWERYGERDFVLLAVNTDSSNHKTITRFVDKHKLTYPILLDHGEEVRDAYKVIGLPVTYLIGRDGTIAGRIIAARDWSSSESIALIEHLLE